MLRALLLTLPLAALVSLTSLFFTGCSDADGGLPEASAAPAEGEQVALADGDDESSADAADDEAPAEEAAETANEPAADEAAAVEEEADEVSDEEVAVAGSASFSADDYPIPDKAGPNDYMSFIDQVEKARPGTASEDDTVKWIQDSRSAIVGAADKALGFDLTEIQRLRAVNAKRRALVLLVRTEAPGAAAELRTFIEGLLKDKDPDVVSQAREQLVSLRLMDFMSSEGKSEPAPKLVADIKAYAAQGEPGQNQFQVLTQCAQVLEQAEEFQLALELYDELGRLFGNSEEPQLAKAATAYQKAAQRRLTLVGQPLEIEGTLLNGDKIDWAKYRGKVVLVDFWATWCGPCIKEMPNVRAEYEKYHGRGFEVVAISIDDTKEPVDEFYKTNNVPWPTLHDVTDEGQSPLAEKYGIMAIPAPLLVGKDGKVITLSARGEKLGKLLAELLGPAETADTAEEEGTDPALAPKKEAAAETVERPAGKVTE